MAFPLYQSLCRGAKAPATLLLSPPRKPLKKRQFISNTNNDETGNNEIVPTKAQSCGTTVEYSLMLLTPPTVLPLNKCLDRKLFVSIFRSIIHIESCAYILTEDKVVQDVIEKANIVHQTNPVKTIRDHGK